jgi:hypothetical protein
MNGNHTAEILRVVEVALAALRAGAKRIDLSVGDTPMQVSGYWVGDLIRLDVTHALPVPSPRQSG